MTVIVCIECGQVKGVAAYDDALWDIYHRVRDGRSRQRGLAFDSEWMLENVIDDEDVEVLKLTMERDMHSRGLCTECGRPDLSGISEDDIMSEEEAQSMHEMWAEQEAERRAGA